MKPFYTLDDLLHWDPASPIRLAVFGDPVAHSRSPQMHNAALAALGVPARYCRLHIRPEELAEALPLLVRHRFIGANFTIPHKAALLPLLDEVDGAGRAIGAVNTVVVGEGGRLTGYNTDGPGLSLAVKEAFGVALRDQRVLLLGAGGGAGRAIAVQCAREGCQRLALVNRTLEKAEALARELEPYFQSAQGERHTSPVRQLEAVPWEPDALAAALAQTDLILNATSLGLKAGDPSPLPAGMIASRHLVYDTIYTAPRTPLLEAAQQAGARGANGASMLLYQGVLAFEHWFHQPAPVEVMRAAMEG